MELPIDHFRLLGISPSADAEEVLRFFQLRLDRIPHKEFTPEVIAQRSELLRRSADLLCDNEMRQEYESALLAGAVGLEFSTNREVAGLILLWEGGVPYEAFKLAKKSLRPPQAPALGSGRESDLTLLAALSCRDAALQEQELRHYASAAELLQEGIQLLQRMGKLPDQRSLLERDLEGLLPYRILDLLSRDLSDQNSHEEGLNLLDSFVLKRGGLEGRNLSNTSIELNQADFELFFQQIRNFLTVQEQIDLFLAWQKRGSSDAGFLGAISLVASGFYWRKPEVLKKARRQLNSLNLDEFDKNPLIGCIDLLLADVHQAFESFKTSNDRDLKDWLDNYPGEELAALCDYCRNWLQRDVLPGFRDIENFSIDLEAWFADRDVKQYIEKIERRGALNFAKAGFSFISSLSSEKSLDIDSNVFNDSKDSSNLLSDEIDEGTNQKNDQLEEEEFSLRFKDLLSKYRESVKAHISSIKTPKFKFGLPLSSSVQASLVISLLFILGTSIGLFLVRKTFNQPQKEDLVAQNTIEKISDQDNNSSIEIRKENTDSITPEKQKLTESSIKITPLKDKFPSDEQIKTLIESWLKGKADILSGVPNSKLSIVARPTLVKIVQDQRLKDNDLGERQIINAVIKSLEIEDQTEKRIAVKAEISYRDKRLSSSDELLSETIIPSLKLRYILGREKNVWQLVDFSSGI